MREEIKFAEPMEEKHYRTITIEEYYKKIDDKVYWFWRYAGSDRKWTKELTPYKEVPYIKLNEYVRVERD